MYIVICNGSSWFKRNSMEELVKGLSEERGEKGWLVEEDDYYGDEKYVLERDEEDMMLRISDEGLIEMCNDCVGKVWNMYEMGDDYSEIMIIDSGEV